MDIRTLKNRLGALSARLPPVSTDEGAAARNSEKLASFARAPEGPRRDFMIQLVVRTSANSEEPDDFQTLVDSIGAEAIVRIFPDGLPRQPTADVRERARAWHAECQKEGATKTTSELRAGIAEILRGQIAHEILVTP